MQLCGLLVGMMLSALVVDAISMHSVFGAFVFRLVVLGGVMGTAVVEKLEDFVTSVMLSLFFVSSGLRTDVKSIKDPLIAGLLLVFVLASVAKVAVTTVVAVFYTMPFRDRLLLGFLMNTRGLVEQQPCFCQYLRNPTLGGYINSPNGRRMASACRVPFPRC